MKAKRFEGKVALVTGAARGIGKAIALGLAREGTRTVLVDIDERPLGATARQMSRLGTRVLSIRADVSRSEEVQAMVDQAVKWAGKIDILIHAAGVGKECPFLEVSEDLWDWTLDTNLKGSFLCSQAVARVMAKKKYGKILFLASTNSYDGEEGMSAYNASKAGVALLAQTVARELAPYGIYVNALGPGWILTRLTRPFLKQEGFLENYLKKIPLGRHGRPSDLVGPALFLVSDEASFVTGTVLIVDGGQLA